ncbi:hypothetical protein LCY76_16910 [Fictibacillus sp. KIGAM418]|uniref:Uncharacterized protein n=1 Tax=Fictibacillus marinisediminis TaxID=2878389 RepID=A0A9X1XFS2_9BACL|nr:hypothetical protein [Fictibacillus marinisediminis]MCK6258255.1 hypothetical protein [Fictibacillus marinisediminis]
MRFPVQMPVQGAQQNRNRNQRPIQVVQNCNCGRQSTENPVMGAMENNQQPSLARPRCRRFCQNVCRSLFGRNREQCIADCLACRGNQGNTMGSMDDNDDCSWRSSGPRGDVFSVQSDMNDGHYWDYED